MIQGQPRFRGRIWRLRADASDKDVQREAVRLGNDAVDVIGWLPDAATEVMRYRVGDDALLIVRVPRRHEDHAPTGFYVVLDEDNYWRRLYGPVATRAGAERLVVREIGPSPDLFVLTGPRR